MLDKAKEKISDEMALKHSDEFFQTIGQFLLDTLKANPSAADKIMDKGKTITAAITTVRSEARKKAVNGMAKLNDREVGSIIYKYFGIDNEVIPMEEPKHTNAPASKLPSSDFDVRLEDLL